MVIVGSDLKQDGYTWNAVDPTRVTAFMAAARGDYGVSEGSRPTIRR